MGCLELKPHIFFISQFLAELSVSMQCYDWMHHKKILYKLMCKANKFDSNRQPDGLCAVCCTFSRFQYFWSALPLQINHCKNLCWSCWGRFHTLAIIPDLPGNGLWVVVNWWQLSCWRARSDQISTACTLLKNPLLVHQYKVTTPFLLLQEFIKPTTPRRYHHPSGHLLSSLYAALSGFWLLPSQSPFPSVVEPPPPSKKNKCPSRALVRAWMCFNL